MATGNEKQYKYMATGNYFLIIRFSDVTEWSEQISWVCEADDDPYLLCDSISEDDVIWPSLNTASNDKIWRPNPILYVFLVTV
jgi:hypothetical protein